MGNRQWNISFKESVESPTNPGSCWVREHGLAQRDNPVPIVIDKKMKQLI